MKRTRALNVSVSSFLPLFALSSVTTLIYLVAFSRPGRKLLPMFKFPLAKNLRARSAMRWILVAAGDGARIGVSSPPFGWNFRGRIIWNVCSHSCGRASVGVHSRRNYCKFTSTPRCHTSRSTVRIPRSARRTEPINCPRITGRRWFTNP